MFISAAITGAVPKRIDPIFPRFIAQEYLDNFVGNTNRESTISTIGADGWQKTDAGGLGIRINGIGVVDSADLGKLSTEERAAAESWLSSNGWQKITDKDAGEFWQQPPAQYEKPPAIPAEAIKKIADGNLQRQVILQFTDQGWQFDPSGNLFWPHKQGESYLAPKYVKELENKAPDFIKELQAVGWDKRGPGYWKAGQASSTYLPLFPQQIAEEAHRSALEGAAIVHFHTRDLTQTGVYSIPGMALGNRRVSQLNKIDVSQYEQIVPQVLKSDPSLILNLSTSVRGSGGAGDAQDRSGHLKGYGLSKLAPDVGSFSPGDVIFQTGGGYANSPEFIERQAQHMKTTGVRPEVEVFNNTILENATGKYKELIRDIAVPPLFMLVTGVDQYKTWPGKTPGAPEPEDDSLIPKPEREKIFKYLMQGDDPSRQKATEMTVGYLRPVVEKLRMAHPDAKISTLMAGPMQLIATDVALDLGLDGIRIGLEDGLNVADSDIPGAVRKATGTADQVRQIRKELAAKGVEIETSEQLRDTLGIERPEIKLFRKIEQTLEPFAKDLPDKPLQRPVSEMMTTLAPMIAEYKTIEDRFVEDALAKTAGLEADPKKMARIIWDVAKERRVSMRFFHEEAERYERPADFPAQDMYTLQPLNFMREVLAERGMDAKRFDEAIERYTPATPGMANPSKLIPASQFKDLELRFLDFAVFIPSIYNFDRTGAANVEVRQDAMYSKTMSLLLTAVQEKMVELRKRANVPEKQSGILWHELIPTPQEEKTFAAATGVKPVQVSRERLAEHVANGGWVVLPSTPATNYPAGIKSANGLATVLRDFIIDAKTQFPDLGDEAGKSATKMVAAQPLQNMLTVIGGTHSGKDREGNTLIEAAMQANRFACNADKDGMLSSYSVQQLYDQMVLPRLLENGDKLSYAEDGTVKRDAGGMPLYDDGSPAKRLTGGQIEQIPLLKMIGHSSGVATGQQIDNLQRKDMALLGYSPDDQRALFRKGILVHLGSAADVHLDKSGTTIVDITAINDIRSIAGTTTTDYIDVPVGKKREFEEVIQKKRAPGGKVVAIDNSNPEIKTETGPEGKSLIRFKGVYLSDDPARLHDGHTIKRYTQEAPPELKALVSIIDQQNSIDSVESLVEKAREVAKAQSHRR